MVETPSVACQNRPLLQHRDHLDLGDMRATVFDFLWSGGFVR